MAWMPVWYDWYMAGQYWFLSVSNCGAGPGQASLHETIKSGLVKCQNRNHQGDTSTSALSSENGTEIASWVETQHWLCTRRYDCSCCCALVGPTISRGRTHPFCLWMHEEACGLWIVDIRLLNWIPSVLSQLQRAVWAWRFCHWNSAPAKHNFIDEKYICLCTSTRIINMSVHGRMWLSNFH